MNYAEEFTAAVRALGGLAVRDNSQLTEQELDVALFARGALLDLLTSVHTHVTGIVARTRVVIEDVETHPVAALGQALRRHRRIQPRQSPTDLLADPAVSVAGQAWQQVARHTLMAQHAWATQPRSRLNAEGSWAAVADLAAVAAVVVELDRDLGLSAAQFPHLEWEAPRLEHSVESGLRVAAREAARLAAKGPVTTSGPNTGQAPNRDLVQVHTADEAIAAQHQLSALLRTAGHVRPERLQIITVAHLRTCAAAADLLPTADDELGSLQPRLARHVRLLNAVAGRRTPAASLDPGDLLPFHQAVLLRQSMASDGALLEELMHDPVRAPALVVALADTTRALAETADRHLTAGTWILPERGGEELRWVRSNTWHGVPEPYQSLRAAAIHAERLTGQASGQSPSERRRATAASSPDRTAWPEHLPAARQILSPAPFQAVRRDRVAGRPEHPSFPSRPMAPPIRRKQMKR